MLSTVYFSALVNLFKDRFSTSVSLDGVVVHLDRQVLRPDEVKTLVRNHYELDERQVIRETLEPSDKVVEIGGGIGLISAICGKGCGAGNTVTYEANPRLIDLMRRNHQLNGLDIRIENLLVFPGFEGEGVRDFYIGERFFESGINPVHGGQKIKVPAISIVELLSREFCSYLIIDIEGAEYELFQDISLPIHIKKLCVEVHPKLNLSNVNIYDLIEQQGFILDQERTCNTNLFFYKR